MSKENKDKKQIWFSQPGGERKGCLVRFLTTLIILILIILVTFFFAIGTEGGRSFVEDWLGKYFGADIVAVKTSIGLPYVLEIDSLATKDFDAGAAGFKAEDVRIGLGVKPLWRVSAQKCELRIIKSGNNWEPPFFCNLGELPGRNLEEISRITRKHQMNMKLRIRGGSIEWLDGGSNVTSSAKGVSFGMTPVKLVDETVCQFDLSVYHATGIDGASVDNIDRSWLAGPGNDYIEIRKSDRESIPSAVNAFWLE